ncbi:N-acetyltransferase family 8 member 3-like [Chaetodon trifascialis]|uniref:N-acetyltransferase family 8 member 3-like n=1 Tax=Chaetodon trifascialis TaxID=109706 RepID=UPI0039938617
MQLVIRRYRPSDKDVVLSLFSTSAQEHILACFHNAMTSPLYIAVTLALCIAGYLLCSVLGAVVFPGVWVGLVYYCCYSIYSRYIREKLQTDMQDIPGNYLSRPDDCYWVAEAEVDGKAQIMGMVAVVGKQSGERRYGELFRMIVSPLSRRMGLGARLAHTAIDFCKERGFSEVVLRTTSTQTAAVALYKKLGFRQVSYTEPTVPAWMAKLAMVKVLIIKKHL